MFIEAKLECGVEILINPSHVAFARFTTTGVQVEFPSGHTLLFPITESMNIRRGLENHEAKIV